MIYADTQKERTALRAAGHTVGDPKDHFSNDNLGSTPLSNAADVILDVAHINKKSQYNAIVVKEALARPSLKGRRLLIINSKLSNKVVLALQIDSW